MHFATFSGSEHQAPEPLFRLVKAREKVLGMEGMRHMEGKGGLETKREARLGVGREVWSC